MDTVCIEFKIGTKADLALPYLYVCLFNDCLLAWYPLYSVVFLPTVGHGIVQRIDLRFFFNWSCFWVRGVVLVELLK